MTDISPPARRRAPVTVEVAPRARTRPVVAAQPVAPPPRRRGVDYAYGIADHLPLPFQGKTHNGFHPSPGAKADPRFAPLVIVMNPEWAKRAPGWVRVITDTALKWQAGDKFPDTPTFANPAYITEWALRHYFKKAMLADDVYEALGEWVIADEKNWNAPQRSMMKVTPEGLELDMTKATGPFYLDTLLAIEIIYADKLRDI